VPRRSLAEPSAEARASFELPADGPVLLVLGGSQGAVRLNELAVERWGASGPAVLHLCGERDHALLRGRITRPDYRLLPFTDQIGAAYGASDLALARAGGSVWELAAAGLPAVLVPYPHATADHQTKNARQLEAAGGAVVVPESDLDAVPALVEELVADGQRRERMRQAMLAVARPGAAAEIAEELVALASV
jgi:UDP-N-acetylglucosamine--N-acetylmuramyl-(pentapeptide) pyrophosphoryl-undecaprenol N-acetylglucosamine transferase